MLNEITYIENFYAQSDQLIQHLLKEVVWDERMRARKTASFGKAYNYSQISYPEQAFPSFLISVLDQFAKAIGFRPNNCLINYYLDGQARMGYHSDQIDILHPDTGIGILSLGDTRILRFRKITDQNTKEDYPLPAGSLIYMTQEVQNHWQHSIPRSKSELPRWSLTFRKIK